jgi:hypothetical protein
MKKSFIITLALLLPVFASGESIDRDVLLTRGGVVYTIDSVPAQPGTTVLRLSIQNGDHTEAMYVPETLAAGYHRNPALAYDSETATLFVLWERGITQPVRSDIAVVSYQGGRWGHATRIPSPATDSYHNLRLGVTRKIEHSVDGRKVSLSELHLHAVWWSDSIERGTEWARYAMLTVQSGEVIAYTVHDMSQFIDMSKVTGGNGDLSDAEVLRHPALIETSDGESIDVVFGSFKTGSLHRVTLKPAFDGRLRIPLGVREGRMGAPRFADTHSTRISTISDRERIILYKIGRDAVKYVMFSDGVWSAERSIALNNTVTVDAAVDAIRRMLARD